MSFFETGSLRLGWQAAPIKHSILVQPGCVQCGSQLVADAAGRTQSAGKCFNCMNFVSDGDEIVDDFED